jgi:putative transcriptional regulator
MSTRKKDAEVEFDAGELVRRVQAFAAHASGKRTLPLLRISEVKVPPPLKPMAPAEIRRIRSSLGVSQAAFAALLNVPKKTATSWESGIRTPSGAALKLLRLVRQKPELLISA